MQTKHTVPRKPEAVREFAEHMGLDTSTLYEAVIELADEGMLTARCINAAAAILLTELGLPEYYFRHLSKEPLKRMLQVIATNIRAEDGHVILASESAHLICSVEENIQILIANSETRDDMEAATDNDISRWRSEYYFSPEHGYYTYIIKYDHCPKSDELGPDDTSFAFARTRSNLFVPQETSHRYEAFRRKDQESVTNLVEVTTSAKTDETRIMAAVDPSFSSLPLIRQLLADHGKTLNRAYWETYRGPDNGIRSICSLYVSGALEATERHDIIADLCSFKALPRNSFTDLYVNGELSFRELLFVVNAALFVHQFVHRSTDMDRHLMDSLSGQDLQDALRSRIFDANRSEFSPKTVTAALRARPDLIRQLYAFFDRRFNPHRESGARDDLEAELADYRRHLNMVFLDDATARDVLKYATSLVSHVQKTNFYTSEKRAFAFRLQPQVLDPIVFPERVYGIFFVVGHHAMGTHMRAANIARGGLRLLRITPANYDNQLDEAILLNHALGPKAQRLKHKDIAECGAKGVIIPVPEAAADGAAAVHDYSDGILDLILPSAEIVDYLGHPEMIFFGPDEGTAELMDAVAERARERKYKYWRTFTTGKSIGIPHDAFGLTGDGRIFALHGRGEAGTELILEGTTPAVTTDTAEISRQLGGEIVNSGMTTTGLQAAFQTLIARAGEAETDLVCMMTGGPDGDLGANQILSSRAQLALIVDAGAVLFDPDGLDRAELRLLALNRHAKPRLNAAAYPAARLGPRGFLVKRTDANVPLPDGTVVENGAYFHRTFLTDPASRRFVEAAAITAFIPCGGRKDTVNSANVRGFLTVFAELQYIVEGANVFFDDTARQTIGRDTDILQIRDSSANKGGVTSSSLAEVLGAFLLGDSYETKLVRDQETRFRLVRELFDIIRRNAVAETNMLLDLHAAEAGTPLCELSVRTSEQLLGLQQYLYEHIDTILADADLVQATLASYVPQTLIDIVSISGTVKKLAKADLRPYRDAIVTKTLAGRALYRHASRWHEFLAELKTDMKQSLRALLASN